MGTEQVEHRTAQSCIYAEGEDDRANNRVMLRKLRQMIGPGIKGLPNENSFLSSGARLAKLYAADIDGMDFKDRATELEFAGSLSATMARLDKEGEWVLENTARTIARSIVLPCKVVLEGSEESKELISGGKPENLPNPISCLVFDWKVRKDD